MNNMEKTATYKSHIIKDNRTRLEDVIPLATPYTVLIEVSRLCNLRCCFCPQSDHRNFTFFKNNMMSIEDLNQIAEQIKVFPQKIKKVYMHGTGESLMNQHLPDMILQLKTESLSESVDLTSNGTLLSHEMSQRLLDAGLDHLHISIEALSAEGYKDIAGANNFNFDSFVENIRFFYNRKKKCRLTIKIADVSIKTDSDKDLFFDKFSILCDEIFIENIYPIWPCFDMPFLCQTNKEGQYGQFIVEKNVCPQIFTNLAIKCNGDISPCSMDWNNKICLGNIHQNTLFEVWKGEELKALRFEHLQYGRHINSLCSECGLPKYSCIDNIDPFREAIIADGLY
jgi:radical SAM protein with 4Fe4S-binding SPASM domain